MPDPLVVDAAMQTILDTHLDAHTRDLTAAWVQAWRDVRAELDAAVLGQVAAGNVEDAVPIDPARLRSALDIVEARLADVADETGRVITSSTDPVVRLGVDGEATMTRAVTPDGVTVHRADAGQISAIIDRTTTSTLTATDDLAPETLDVVRRRLVRGVTVGDSPRLVADQIMADTEQGFLGGLTRALNISRTEMLDAMRAGQAATDRVNRDVLRGWVWVAHLDSRTCFPAGTPVLTERGNVPIEDVKVGDRVVTHTASHRTVTETLARDYTGPMVTLTTEHGTITSTTSHPLLVEREGELHWIEAGQVRDGDSLLRYCDGGTDCVDHRRGQVAVQAGVWDSHYDESRGLHVQVLSSVPVLRPGVPVDAVDLKDRSAVREQEVDGVSPSGDRGLLLEGDAERFESAADVSLGLRLSGVPAVAARRAEPNGSCGTDTEGLPALPALDQSGGAPAALGAVGAPSSGGVEDRAAAGTRREYSTRVQALSGAEPAHVVAAVELRTRDRECGPASFAGAVHGPVVAFGRAEAPDVGAAGLDWAPASLTLDGDRLPGYAAAPSVRVLPLVGGVAGLPAELPATALDGPGRDAEGASALATGHFHTEIISRWTTHNQAVPVYNIEVSEDHSYIAAGYAVHNCRSCVAMHGTEHDLDEDGPHDHHSGRCARVPLTRPWADLGFPGVPEPDLGLDDPEAWFGGLGEDEQRAMLTPRGYDAWKAGDYPMSAWSERRENPGWRDTMVPSRPPK